MVTIPVTLVDPPAVIEADVLRATPAAMHAASRAARTTGVRGIRPDPVSSSVASR